MKQIISILLCGAMLVFLGCQSDSSLATAPENAHQETSLEKPAPNLVGSMDMNFTFTPPTFWNGTIDFGADGKYSLTFISYGPPRDYSNASPFKEDFIVYELNTDWTDQENVYLKGWNKGVTVYAQEPLDPAKFVANGKVTEAYGPLKGWLGRNLHISGNIFWAQEGLPESAIATMRIN